MLRAVDLPRFSRLPERQARGTVAAGSATIYDISVADEGGHHGFEMVVTMVGEGGGNGEGLACAGAPKSRPEAQKAKWNPIRTKR